MQNFWKIKFTLKKHANYDKIHSKLPIFCVKSVNIYTGQKNLHGYARGARDKYQVWMQCDFYIRANEKQSNLGF